MLAQYVLLLAVVAVVVSGVYNRRFHPLSKFPGPFWAAQTDVWRVYQLWTRRMPDTLVGVHAKYGPVVRIGPNDLSFQPVEAINPIYKSGRKMIKSNFYDGFTTFHPNLFGTRDEELHAKRRRQMAHDFSLASLAQMEAIFDRHIHHLLRSIESFDGEPFDLKELVAFYTYDLMGELIFNAEFGSLAARDPSRLPPINEHIFLGCMYGMLPALLPYSMTLSKYVPLPWLRHLLASRQMLRDRTAQHVAAELDRRRQKSDEDDGKQTPSILTRLIAAKDPETGEVLTEAEISSEAFAFLVAGSHTTSGTLTLLFYHLLHNPPSAEKLTRELSETLQLADVVVDADQSLPAYSGLEMHLPYATACIRENFRVSPVFTMPLPRTVCDPDGAVIAGFTVPQGSNVCIVNHVSHHDPSAWGEDHDTFRPERWLDPSEESLSPHNLLPFGAGHRACVGRNVATMSIVKVLTAVWRRFDVQPVHPHEPLIVESVGIGEKKGPLMVTAKRRTS